MSTQPLRNASIGFMIAITAASLSGCSDSGNNGGTGATITISAPTIVSPNTSSPINENPPTLTVANVTVSDGSGASYTFQVATDASFASVLRQADNIAQGASQTSWTLGSSLATGAYFWRAHATAGGTVGPWSGTGEFIIGGVGGGPGETTVVFDDLMGSTLGEQHGGSLTPQGWRVNTNADFIRYEVPTVTNGYVQWQNTGLTRRGANENSFMLFGMWDPTAGAYRQNPYRVHLQKLWNNPHNPPFLRLRWISGGIGSDPDPGTNFTDWDPGQTYTFRVDWGPAAGAHTARVFLDGMEIIQWRYNRPYQPNTHFIELGINNERSESVIDAVYKNLQIVRRED